MSNALETRPQSGSVDLVERTTIVKYLDAMGLGEGLTPGEKEQFIEAAGAFQLNPFKREIYCLAYGDGAKRKLSILTGFEVYLKRAERTGLLDGWKVWTDGTIAASTVKKEFNARTGGKYTKDVTVWKGNLKAVIEIYRKDRNRPFTHEVYFTEYTQDNEMWAGKPMTMIKKVAMSQGFRLCFPDELGGLPYTPDELPDEMTTMRTVIVEATAKGAKAPGPNKGDPDKSSVVPVQESAVTVEDDPATEDERLAWPAVKIIKLFAEFANPHDEHGQPLVDWVFDDAYLDDLRTKVRGKTPAELLALYDATKAEMKARKIAQLDALPDNGKSAEATAAEQEASDIFDFPPNNGANHE